MDVLHKLITMTDPNIPIDFDEREEDDFLMAGVDPSTLEAIDESAWDDRDLPEDYYTRESGSFRKWIA